MGSVEVRAVESKRLIYFLCCNFHIHTVFFLHFCQNVHLTNAQHAQTNTASVHMKDQCYSHMNNQKFLGALLLDVTAEFTLSFHPNEEFSFRKDIMCHVFYGGTYSNSKEIYCVVPQGCCLGPLFFLTFRNCLPYFVKTNKQKIKKTWISYAYRCHPSFHPWLN